MESHGLCCQEVHERTKELKVHQQQVRKYICLSIQGRSCPASQVAKREDPLPDTAEVGGSDLGPDSCVPFQIMSNYVNLPQGSPIKV